MASAVEKLSNKTTSDDLAKQVETLRNDLSELTGTIAALTKEKRDEVVSTAQAKAAGVKDKAVDTAETAKLHALELQDQANDFVKNQPAMALGIAAGLGFLVGFMGARK